MNVPYFRPSIGEEEKAAVAAVLNSGWLTSGKAVKDFESRFAAFVGAPHAVAVNSCTAALHLSLEAVGVGPGDAVLVPAMTFAATAAVVRHLGARPVLVDCDSVTLCVDPAAMEMAILTWKGKERLKAMIPMHYGGQPADMDRLAPMASKHGLAVVEDAAHALPAYSRQSEGKPWRMVGTLSPLTCYSFYANKCITTGEGGMIVGNDAALVERARTMSLHGLSKSAWSRFESKGSWYYEIVAPGFKYNLTDLAAAIGVAQLAKANQFFEQRARIARLYAARLAALGEFVETHTELPDRRSSWHVCPIRLHLDRLTIDRARFMEILKERGIVCSVHWMPLHLHPYYKQTYGYQPEDLPVAAREWMRLISLPIFPTMTEEEVDYVCDSIKAVAIEHRKITRRPAIAARNTAGTGIYGD
jgi:perosamine synthetase